MRLAILLIFPTVGFYHLGLTEFAELTRLATTFVLCMRGGREIVEAVTEVRQERLVASRRSMAVYLG